MPTCPNCNYELVLLSSRQKYKCALCSRFYPKQEIENKEFIIKNKLQKELDINNSKEEFENQWNEFKGLRKDIGILFNGVLWNSKDHRKEYHKKWRAKNKDKLRIYRKEGIKLREKDIIYNHRLKQRLAYWRAKQKGLALQFLENKEEKACNGNIFQTPFTFSLSELLEKEIII